MAPVVNSRMRSAMHSHLVVDSLIVAATLAGSLAILGHGLGLGTPGAKPDAREVGLGLLAVAPLYGWRRAPVAAFVASASLSALAVAQGYLEGIPLAAPVAVYLLTVSCDDSRPWRAPTTAVVIALLGASLLIMATRVHGWPIDELLHIGPLWALAWFAGERTRLHHAHVRDLHERAVTAERDAERERLLAVADERARIARDLHDSAGHAINVIAVRAGAARLRYDASPNASRQALEAIEDIARETAADVDRIVHALRDDGSAEADGRWPVSLESLQTLVSTHRESGLDVTVRTSGVRRALSRSADQAVYRVLQEALTNAARHGAGPVAVDLCFAEAELRLVVSNSMKDSDADDIRRNGRGLIGMRERLMLLGGSLEAGPDAKEFRVDARVPIGIEST
jgi:signal transduction histidine kinase